MDKGNLLKLNIMSKERGYSIFLDEKEIHHVENYKIESTSLTGCSKLTLEVLVAYP